MSALFSGCLRLKQVVGGCLQVRWMSAGIDECLRCSDIHQQHVLTIKSDPSKIIHGSVTLPSLPEWP